VKGELTDKINSGQIRIDQAKNPIGDASKYDVFSYAQAFLEKW
jgi:hypothetical protein